MVNYGMFTGGLGFHYGAEKIGMTVIPSATGNTKRQIEMINDFGVTTIHCTPSYAMHLSEVAEEMGTSLDSPENRSIWCRALVGECAENT